MDTSLEEESDQPPTPDRIEETTEEEIIDLHEEVSSEGDTSTDDSESMDREELKAHLGQTEQKVETKVAEMETKKAEVEKVKKEVESMASEIKSGFERIETKLDEKLNTAQAVEDKIDSNTTWAFRMSAITLTIVSLILGALGVVLTILFQMSSLGGS